MELFDDTLLLERQQFFNGQRLFASDLQGLEAFNRRMRWLHNQSLHQPGIGNGFNVIGNKEDREVKIMPGYIVDSLGREIVLTEEQIMPVPPVAGNDNGTSVFFYLTVSYPDTEDLEVSETRAGICLDRGVIRRREEPVFCWIPLEESENETLKEKDSQLAEEIRKGLRIILARAEVLNCQLEQPLSFAQRRSARPAVQPYIAAGSVENPEWEFCNFGSRTECNTSEIPLPPFSSLLYFERLLSADINTEEANFVTTPCYSAHIIGDRTFQSKRLFIDGLINIVDPNPRGFTINVLLLLVPFPNTTVSTTLSPRDFSNNKWQVSWMGVEG
jgi:hypothetical protein